jgi:hypothetical protein
VPQVSIRTPLHELPFSLLSKSPERVSLVVVKNIDCAKRMTVWCILAVALVTVFIMAGYGLFESGGQAPTLQREQRPNALADV